jgi:phospholipid/cholesterol/gamma-HCH transport system substrate-binding protein
MVERRISELKVGIFFLLAIILAIIVIFAVQGWWTTGKGYELNIIFPDASGLQEGAPVRLAGVEVGRVIEISLTPDAKASVKARLRKGVEIYSGYSIKIAVPLFGERYIDIKPREPRGTKVAEGQTVIGEIPISLEEMTSNIQSLVSTLREEITSFQKAASSLLKEEVSNAVKGASELIARATKAVDNISSLTQNADKILLANRENLEQTTGNLREATGFLRDMFGESKENIAQATKNIQESTSELRGRLLSISSQLEEIAEDVKKASARSEAIVSNIETASVSLEKTMANLESVTADVKQLTGNKEFIQDIQGSVKTAREALEEAKILLQETSRRIKGLGKLQIEPSASLTFNEKRENLRLSPQIYLPYQGLTLGLWDIGESNKFELQKVLNLGKINLRGGIIRAKPGIGIDLLPYLSLNVYDLNHAKGDFYLNLGENPSLQLGVEDIFSSNEFIWGLGYKWRK